MFAACVGSIISKYFELKNLCRTLHLQIPLIASCRRVEEPPPHKKKKKKKKRASQKPTNTTLDPQTHRNPNLHSTQNPQPPSAVATLLRHSSARYSRTSPSSNLSYFVAYIKDHK